MEESEKRRERLKAMRLEANNSNESTSSSSQQTLNCSTPLANPLLDNPDSNSASTPPHRFDFYTDPMAAYATTDKRRPPTPTPQFPHSSFGPRNAQMPPPPGVQQFQNNYGPQPSPPGVQQFQNNYGPQRPPPGAQQFQNNYGPQRPPPGAQQFQNNHGPHVQQFQNNYGPHQGMYQGGDPYYSPGPTSSSMGMRSPYHPANQGSPNFSNAPGRGEWFNNNPSPGSGYGGSPYPMYQGSPNSRPPPQGRGHWANNSPRPGSGYGGSPSPSVGRGRGQWDNSRMNSSSGYSDGRGRGRGRGYFVGRGHSDGRGRSFYNKSMVEDPWESLTPVIWQGVTEDDVKRFPNNRGYYQKTPFEKNPIAKKPRVSNPFDASNSKKGGSLADFLAESFDEAGEDAATV